MSKINVFMYFAAISIFTSSANAMNVGDLITKNKELQTLDADILIARKKAELNTLKETKTAGYAAPVKPKNSTDLENVSLVALFGDTQNPTAEFSVNGVSRFHRSGDTIDGWRLTSLGNRNATFSKETGKGRSKKTTTKVVYLTPKPAAPVLFQTDRPQPGAAMPIPIPTQSPIAR